MGGATGRVRVGLPAPDELAPADLERDAAQRLHRTRGGPVDHADPVEEDQRIVQRFGTSTFVRNSFVKISSQEVLRGMSGMYVLISSTVRHILARSIQPMPFAA